MGVVDAASPTSNEPEMAHQLLHPIGSFSSSRGQDSASNPAADDSDGMATDPPEALRDPSREVLDVHPTDMYVPFLAVEYKKDNPEVPRKGPNQLRVYNTAMSKFLSHLGIIRFPVFGLLTEGTVGVVTCTYTEHLSDDSFPATDKACPVFLHVSPLVLTDT